jgi:hypothetical protein
MNLESYQTVCVSKKTRLVMCLYVFVYACMKVHTQLPIRENGVEERLSESMKEIEREVYERDRERSL